MNKGTDNEDKDVVVTPLSKGSSNLFKDNSLTLFSNKLHNPKIFNPSSYNTLMKNLVSIQMQFPGGNVLK